MVVYKSIELVGVSENSFDEAAKNAVLEATKTIRKIKRVSVEQFDIKVEEDKPVAFRARVKIWFEIERS